MHASILVLGKVFITLVMLVAWLDGAPRLADGTCPQSYDILDFFAGAGRLARAGRRCGETTAAFDIGYHHNRRVFDMNSSSGFALLVLKSRVSTTNPILAFHFEPGTRNRQPQAGNLSYFERTAW